MDPKTEWRPQQIRMFATDLRRQHQNAANFLQEAILEALVDQKALNVFFHNHRDVSRESIGELRDSIKAFLTRGPGCIAAWFG